MPRDLRPIVHPAHEVAVLVVEMQRLTTHTTALPVLAENTRALVAPIAQLTAAARDAGAQVIYTLMAHRDDGRAHGSRTAPARREMNANGTLADGLVADERDFVLHRWHGMNPVYNTGVEPMLRHMGARTVVLTGVSLNVSLVAAAIDLHSGGFRVVIPRDCVAATSAEYGDMVLRETMRAIATVTTSQEIVSVWAQSGG